MCNMTELYADTSKGYAGADYTTLLPAGAVVECGASEYHYYMGHEGAWGMNDYLNGMQKLCNAYTVLIGCIYIKRGDGGGGGKKVD